MSEAQWLRVVVIVVILAGVGIYVLEKKVLVGTPVAGGTANISEITPAPAFPISLHDGNETIRVYLDSEDDMSVNITVLDPSQEAIHRQSADLGKVDFTFEAGAPGIYSVLLTSESDRGRITVNAWTNDRRLFSGCF